MEHPYVKNLETLYQVSGMLDQLRDTALAFNNTGHYIAESTLKQMAKQYDVMRARLRDIFKEDAVAGLDRLVPVLDHDKLSVGDIYFVAAALARWSDMVHTTPKFLMEWEVFNANMDATKTNLKEFEDKKTVKQLSPAPTPIGTYL